MMAITILNVEKGQNSIIVFAVLPPPPVGGFLSSILSSTWSTWVDIGGDSHTAGAASAAT